MLDIDPERFRELVADALDSIPPELASMMENVNVFVDDRSPPRGLFGVYEGIPLTERDAYGGYGGMVMPDRIVIFRRAICAACSTAEEVEEQVRVTVIHEVAHHFGIGDDRLHELGWA